MYRHPEDQENLASVAATDQAMTWELSETIAGVIMERSQGGGGILMPPKGYLKKVKDIRESHGALSL
ncbi:aminotransferase class III-fold pyridoxal phosphate-dependent enzyme [Bacillus sp. SL00103]